LQCDQVQSPNTHAGTTEVDQSQNPEPIPTEVPNAQVPNSQVPNAQVEDATQSSNTLPAQSNTSQSSQETQQNNEVDMIINGLKALLPAQNNEAVTQMVDELLNWDKNIAKVQGKRVKTVGNPSENQTEQMMTRLRSLPPEELKKVTRELLQH